MRRSFVTIETYKHKRNKSRCTFVRLAWGRCREHRHRTPLGQSVSRLKVKIKLQPRVENKFKITDSLSGLSFEARHDVGTRFQAGVAVHVVPRCRCRLRQLSMLVSPSDLGRPVNRTHTHTHRVRHRKPTGHYDYL